MPKAKISRQEDDWEKSGGLFCPSCGNEVVRIIEGRCPQCHQAMIAIREAQAADRAERRYVVQRLREGTLSLHDLKRGRL